MTVPHTRIWDYDAVEIGQEALPIVSKVTAESIQRHAAIARSVNPSYHCSDPPVAMPTQIFGLAPKNRGGIAENNGMSVITAHATPFAKAESRWVAPVRLGDTVTSVARVSEKYERRGNRFVTIRLEPRNQRGEKLAEIDHTSIFEFGKREGKGLDTPSTNGKPGEALEPSTLRETTQAEAVEAVTAETVEVGGTTHPLTVYSPPKAEVDGLEVSVNEIPSQSSGVDGEPGRFPWGAVHGVGGITIMAYIVGMLERWAPESTLYGGGSLLFKAVENFRPGDTNTYRGTIVAKSDRDGKRLVNIDVVGVNQNGQLTGVADATVVFP